MFCTHEGRRLKFVFKLLIKFATPPHPYANIKQALPKKLHGNNLKGELTQNVYDSQRAVFRHTELHQTIQGGDARHALDLIITRQSQVDFANLIYKYHTSHYVLSFRVEIEEREIITFGKTRSIDTETFITDVRVLVSKLGSCY